MVITAELWHYRYSDDHLLREAIMANNYSEDIPDDIPYEEDPYEDWVKGIIYQL